MTAQSSLLPRRHSPEVTIGLTMMFLAVLVSPIIDIFSKLATATVPPVEVTAVRFILQLLFALPTMAFKRSWGVWSFRNTGLHIARGGVLTMSMICFVTTLKVMEVADAIAIFFVEPIILTILSSIFLKETIGWRRYSACAVGFLGAMLIIQPSFQNIGPVALLPMVTAFCIAIYALLTRVASHHEDAWPMQFQTSLWGLVFSVALLYFGRDSGLPILDTVAPSGIATLHLLGVGASAAVSGILSVYAYRSAPASTLAPLQYFEIVSATIFGWLVFGNFPDLIKWVGIAIIVASGLFILWRERLFASKPVSDTSEAALAP
jgi:S-adenosylmethionine uptake transporter